MNDNPTTKRFSDIGWIIAGILIAALAWYFIPDTEPLPTLKQATLLTPAKPIQPFTLHDSNGQPFTLEQLTGHWSLLFFGYTHCPDVCPTTLQTLATMVKRLQANYPDTDIPQVVFVSVDPARDDDQRLNKFVHYFNKQFVGVTGTPEQIENLTRQLGIIFAKVKGSTSGDYLVDHSAAIILIDPKGNFSALFGVPHNPEHIASDLATIEHYYAR